MLRMASFKGIQLWECPLMKKTCVNEELRLRLQMMSVNRAVRVDCRKETVPLLCIMR